MTQAEIKTALIGRRVMLCTLSGGNIGWYTAPQPIDRVEFDLDNKMAHLYAGMGKSYDIAMSNVERLAKRGSCEDGKYSYRLRPRKEGE